MSGVTLIVGVGLIALAPAIAVRRNRQERLEDLVSLVADLETIGPGATLRSALRRALADPSLDIVYLRAGSGGWVNQAGESMSASVDVGTRTTTPIEREGKPIAALVHDASLLRRPERLRAAVAAASLAIDNERLKVELRAEVRDAHASRSRIVLAGDRERRRVERNLHDGAQQRLVGLALTLRLASRRAAGDAMVTDLLTEAAGELDSAIDELRELARGIHPAIVTDAGLVGALETLAERPGVPVELHLELDGRLPEVIEVGAYYLVLEAVTNANKHAGASHIAVRAGVVDGALHLAVSDDGRGLGEAVAGMGMQGLLDRVSALGGSLAFESDPGTGTTLQAEIPLDGDLASGAVDRRRAAALRWMGWDQWEIPAEAYDQLTDEDNLQMAKAVMLCAGGPFALTECERKWLIGNQAAAGTVDWVLEAIDGYEGDDSLAAIVALPGMAPARRGVLYDAVRMCWSDGPVTDDELTRLRAGAQEMSVPASVLDRLVDAVREEQRARRQRYELIVAPMLPAAGDCSGQASEGEGPTMSTIAASDRESLAR